MFTHQLLWATIDHIAELNNLTASGLARKAGLDATSFNKSKRIAPDGRQRWPSTETLSKVLAVVGMDLEAFASVMASLANPSRRRSSASEIVHEAAE